MTWIVATLILLWVGLNFAVVWFASRPFRTPSICSPGALGTPQENVVIKSHDLIELSGWWVQGDHPKNVAILCHGFFLAKGELSSTAYLLWQQGFSCLLFDFRAHGKSVGGTCSFGYHEKDDVVSAMEWVKKRNPESKIVLIGSSMGSVASAMAWSENPEMADALVLDSAYANLGKAVGGWWRFIGGHAMAFFFWPAVFLGVLVLGFNPFMVHVPEYLEKLQGRPVLMMHGSEDPVATPKQAGKNLFALGPGADAVWFKDCSHSEGRWEQPEKYRTELLRFLTQNGFLKPKDQEMKAN